MKKMFLLLLTGSSHFIVNGQSNPRIGGSCEDCEAIYESPIAFEKLSWTDTLPDFNEPGPKMVISGKIYQADKKTPAAGVVLYVYHTDQTGKYTPSPDQKGHSRKHGRLQGWVKTNQNGEYKFYTLKPAHYPGNQAPAHIHCIIKEPNKNEYWIDEFLFDDDPVLSADERKRQEKRGGNGIVLLQQKNGMLSAERNIFLGMNIPNYL